MLINFYFHLRCYLLLGSSTLFGFGATHIFISRKLCYTMCLVHLRTLFFSHLFLCRCGSAYIKPFSFLFFNFWQCILFFSLTVVFLFILRLPEQIASSCSSTCNTCNTAGCTHHDASRVDASLEDVVSSSQAPPSIHSH